MEFDARWTLRMMVYPSANLKIGVKSIINDGLNIIESNAGFYGYVCENNVVFDNCGHIINLPAPYRFGGNDIIIVRLTINDAIQRLSFYKNGERIYLLTQEGLPTAQDIYYKLEIRIKNVGESVSLLNFITK